jgi:hypothetical protein
MAASLLAAARSLRLPWLLGIALTLTFALIAVSGGRNGLALTWRWRQSCRSLVRRSPTRRPWIRLREVATAAPY